VAQTETDEAFQEMGTEEIVVEMQVEGVGMNVASQGGHSMDVTRNLRSDETTKYRSTRFCGTS